MLITFATLHK